jgi:hypothetical protein
MYRLIWKAIGMRAVEMVEVLLELREESFDLL